MRLINIRTLNLEEFFGHQIPKYAILSHRWEEEEVTFDDWQSPWIAKQKKGYVKIRNACRFALSLPTPPSFEHIWIDTCCIDKRSSAELSEAINSMFQWYQNSSICLVYLSDVDSLRLFQDSFTKNPRRPSSLTDVIQQQFLQSAWFTRGWTLQELLAPKNLLYLSRDWEVLGDHINLQSHISKASRIPLEYIARWKYPDDASIAEKMLWASHRQSTRIEDTAYCLLGLFNINMPLLYGEGGRAFRRLQAEIIKESKDHSIFAWKFISCADSSVFAPSPRSFYSSAMPTSDLEIGTHHYYLTNNGLRMTLPIFQTADQDLHIAILNVSVGPMEDKGRLCLIVKGLGPPRYGIVGAMVIRIPVSGLWNLPKKKVYLINRAAQSLLRWDVPDDSLTGRSVFVGFKWDSEFSLVCTVVSSKGWTPKLPDLTMGTINLEQTTHPSGTQITVLMLLADRYHIWVAISFNEFSKWSVSAFENQPPDVHSNEDLVEYLERKPLGLSNVIFNVQYPEWPRGLLHMPKNCPLMLISIKKD